MTDPRKQIKRQPRIFNDPKQVFPHSTAKMFAQCTAYSESRVFSSTHSEAKQK